MHSVNPDCADRRGHCGSPGSILCAGSIDTAVGTMSTVDVHVQPQKAGDRPWLGPVVS